MLNCKLIYCPAVNYALILNHIPVVKCLLIDNDSDETLENLNVNITLVSDEKVTYSTVVDTIPPHSYVNVTTIKLNFDAKEMAVLTEIKYDELLLKIIVDEEVKYTENVPINILPFDQWIGESVVPELLAAFVTPNYPNLAPILHRASEILNKWTGNPSFDQYFTRNPSRVKMQMGAIYEAISELGIVYCTPPASFGYEGQRIRMCDTLLNQKLGTCMDMALLYASCIEAIGLNPIIILYQQHAFAGAWLVDDTFADTVSDDISFLTKRLADGINELAVVEATCMNSGKEITFDMASALAENNLLDYNDFQCVIDVMRCRFASILPLPQRIIDGGNVSIVESKPLIRTNETPTEVQQDTEFIDFTKTESSKQRVWERKLLDLSLRNNLLNIRLTKNTLQLMSINVASLEDSLAAGDEFAVLPKPSDWNNGVMDAGIFQEINRLDPVQELISMELTQKRLHSYLNEQELAYALTNLYRSSRSSMEENGANTLYLALGLLKWYETPQSERPRYAPILLLPVEIIRKSAAKGFVIRSREEEVMMNITLLEMLRQDFEINIGGLEVLPKDDSGVDVKLVFNTIRHSIMNQPHWDVDEQVMLGVFSFNKFIMWNDIHNNAEYLCENKIVQSLISGMMQWEGKDLEQPNLDKEFAPADVALPISADSYQMEAVCSADAGESFILHGPPGTGKSQTITNIIANALYKGKKVLFVAEKMAALSVVQKRLADIGLAPFCLELHSNKTKKSAVLEQLRLTTEIVKRRPNEEYVEESQRLFDLRSELSRYVDILHHKNNLDISLYDAICGYTRVEHSEDEFTLTPEMINLLSKSKYTIWRDIIDEMQTLVNICGSIENHPLRDLHSMQYSLSMKDDIKSILDKKVELLHRYKNLYKSLVSSLFGENLSVVSSDEFRSFNDLMSTLNNCKFISSNMMKHSCLSNLSDDVSELLKRGRQRDAISTALLTNYSKSILDIDAETLLLQWRQSENSWFLPKFLQKHKIISTLKGYTLNGKMVQSTVKKLLEDLSNYHEQSQFVVDKSNVFSPLFGELWQKWDSMQECFTNSLVLSERINSISKDITKGTKCIEVLAEKFGRGVAAFTSIYGADIAASVETFKSLDSINSELNDKYLVLPPNGDNWIENHLEQSGRLANNTEHLRDWCNWNTLSKKVAAEGLGSLLEYVSIHDKCNILRQFENALYKHIIESTIDSEPLLANFSGVLFEEKIAKFKQLTKEFERLTREELYAKLSANIPSFVKEASQSSELGILQRNIRNKGRGMSIRRLFDTIPSLLSRIAPCMLMSPMSVAQYLDAKNTPFDLVIFDEASQMPTCEAVGAIARGKSLIVVGDPKQMPPTSFFSTNSVDEDNLDKEDLESILDDCLALSIPSKHLLWHYRSKHESLIAFSNSQYYENKLLTFPSPDDILSKVTHSHVEGYYDKGKSRQNRAEAQAIVSDVIKRLSDPILSQRSIGIVTFSSVQQMLIEDLLNEAYLSNHLLEEKALNCAEPIFVKNLENVQGDERDVILFSVGYGPDKEGKVSLNFGPLNRDGGWRRLNVAVSRARYEMRVYSTLRSDQIDLARTSSEGVAGLKAFLEYAEKGKNSYNAATSSSLIKHDEFIEMVANRIKTLGYEVNVNIGCSGYRVDMGVVDPHNKSEYLLGIVCDGENYRSAKSCRDREIIQTDVLGLLGWNIYRIWSMDWIDNPQRVLENIKAQIVKAEQHELAPEEPKTEEIQPQSVENKSSENQSVEMPSSAVEVEPCESKYKIEYQYYPVETCGIASEEFGYDQHLELIEQQILAVLEVESPISREQLCRRVLSMWNISRIGKRIDSCFDSIFQRMKLTTTIDDGSQFIWRANQDPNRYMNYRVSNLAANDISPYEISVAVKEVLENQISMTREDLVREVAHTFGFTRLGTIVVPAMECGIKRAIIRKFAESEDGRVKLL